MQSSTIPQALLAPLRTALPALALFLAAPLATARGSEGPAPSTRALGSPFREAHATLERGGRIEGHGHLFQATFDEGGFTFLPALGAGAPRDFPVRFVFEDARRGQHSLPGLRDDLAPTRVNDRVTFERGAGLVERYDVSARGVHQSFVLDERPVGSGDLVVRGRLETELVASAAADGGLDLTWNGVDGVHVTGVVGIDAGGGRVEGELRVFGGQLELSLPEGFVDAADYPLVLDPLFGTLITISDAAQVESEPEASKGNAFTLVVWERRFSADHQAIYGQRVSGVTGGLWGGLIPVFDDPVVNASDPSAGWVRAGGAWLVAFSYSGAPGSSVIFGCNVGGDGSVSTAERLSWSVSNFASAPDVGGDNTGSDNEAFLVYQEDEGIRGNQITVQAGQAPFFTGPHFMIDPNEFGNEAIRPRVSSRVEKGTTFLVVWELDLDDLNGKSFVRGRMYTRDGAPLTGEFALYKAFDEFHGHFRPDCDGDGDTFLATWERSEAFGSTPTNDVVVRALQWDGSSVAFGSQYSVAADDDQQESDPAVTITETNAVVGFRQVGGFVASAYLRNVDPFTGKPVGGELLLPSSGFAGSISLTRGGGQTSGSNRVLAVWDDVLDGDIQGQLYVTVGDVTTMDQGCGSGGESVVPGALAGNDDFTVHLRDSLPNVPTICVFGITELDFACGSCTLVPMTEVLVSAFTDVYGNASVNVPLGAGLAGVEFLTQWIVVPTSGGSCLGQVDLSSAHRVTIDAQP